MLSLKNKINSLEYCLMSCFYFRRKTRAKVISKDVHSDKKTNYKKSHCTKFGQSKPDFKTCRPTHFTQMQANKEP